MISLLSQVVGLLVSSALVWFVGPLLTIGSNSPLELVEHRLIAISLLVLAWLLILGTRRLLAIKKNSQMLATLGESTQSDMDEEARVVQERFKEALAALKESNKGKKRKEFIYDLPWYIIIGPPGSGKTTALLNAGLTFPLEDKLGSDAIRGAGGTRHCDWWFTDEAVLVDTAGRFTTQDSYSSVDGAGWDSFVSQLKQYRKEQPINGAMVTMSLSDLMLMSEKERASTAATIRERIDELSDGLGIKFPIYFMFTKCDLIAGFSEFFAHFGQEERAQVWGETFEMAKDGTSLFDVSEYEKNFDELVNNLNQQLLDRVHEERDRDERVMMIGFPLQFATIKEIACNFLEDTFATNNRSQDPLLRGVYYTSGTQEGTPMDRMLGRMALDLGVGQDKQLNFSGKGKSFFLKQLLKDVIFREAGIAGFDPQHKRLAIISSALRFSFAILLVIGFFAAWTLSYQDNVASVERVATLVEQIESVDASGDSGVDNLAQLASELSLLEAAARASLQDDFPDLALNEAKRLVNNAELVYMSTLENRLLPTIVSRVEQRLSAAMAEGDLGEVYRLLKAYLMYAGLHANSGAEFQPEFLHQINEEDWAQLFEGRAQVVSELTTHETALLQMDYSEVRVNEPIVNRARGLLKASPLEGQIYQSIKQLLLPVHTYDENFLILAGSKASDLFVTTDGGRLGELVVPGMFTVAGYQNDMLPRIEAQSREYISGNWVMGAHNKFDSPLALDELRQLILNEYKKDYVQQWEAFLAKVQIREAQQKGELNKLLETFALINGPLEILLGAIEKQTNLAAIDARLVDGDRNSVTNSELVGVHFAALNNLAGSEELISLVQEMRKLSVLVNEVQATQEEYYPALDAVQGRVQGDQRDVFRGLRSQIAFLPQPIQNWVFNLKEDAWELVFEQGQVELNRAWQKEVYAPYGDLFGLYPFNPEASEAATLSSITGLFSDSGALERFTRERLSVYAEFQQGRWKRRTIDNQTLSLSGVSLAALGELLAARQTLPKLDSRKTWAFIPKRLSPTADQFTLSIGDARSNFTDSDASPLEAVWPFDGENSDSLFQFYTGEVGIEPHIERGPWSIYRLLQAASVTRIGQGFYEVQFAQEGLASTYELHFDGELDSFEKVGQLQLPVEF